MAESTGGRANHATWVVGIEIPNDGSEPFVILNDSAQARGGIRMPLSAFVDIADDDGFQYFGFSEPPSQKMNTLLVFTKTLIQQQVI